VRPLEPSVRPAVVRRAFLAVVVVGCWDGCPPAFFSVPNPKHTPCHAAVCSVCWWLLPPPQDNYNDFQYGWPHPIGGVYNSTVQYQVCPLVPHPHRVSDVSSPRAPHPPQPPLPTDCTPLPPLPPLLPHPFSPRPSCTRSDGLPQLHSLLQGPCAQRQRRPAVCRHAVCVRCGVLTSTP
jgi:hypothetical protein